MVHGDGSDIAALAYHKPNGYSSRDASFLREVCTKATSERDWEASGPVRRGEHPTQSLSWAPKHLFGSVLKG
jgi:hypothetical protein